MIFLDIETISTKNEELKYNKEKKDAASERYWERINFMPEFNKIFTICLWTVQEWKPFIKNLEWSEEEQIKAFFIAIKWQKICGFNIKGFDIPFIIKRAIKYKIAIPNDLKVFGKKPREMENIIDLQDVYKNWIFNGWWTLDLCCEFLWITNPKQKWIDWSKVQGYYDNWKIDEILEYCARDVQATIDLYDYFKKYNLV